METLYEKIGAERLKKVLDDFYDCVFTDEHLRPLFANSTREEIQEKQQLFLTQFLGGPMGYTQKYGPPRMRQRHLPHRITPSGKDAWLACMKKAVAAQNWDQRLKKVFYEIFPPIAAHMVNTKDNEQ